MRPFLFLLTRAGTARAGQRALDVHHRSTLIHNDPSQCVRMSMRPNGAKSLRSLVILDEFALLKSAQEFGLILPSRFLTSETPKE
jgi:hypothetical protein